VPTVVKDERVATAEVAIPPLVLTAFPIAVRTPVPVVVVDGAEPAPPPIMIALAASKALVAIFVVELKYGIPPLVAPDTVSGKAMEPVHEAHAIAVTPEFVVKH